jgi:hypothetical protein
VFPKKISTPTYEELYDENKKLRQALQNIVVRADGTMYCILHDIQRLAKDALDREKVNA